MRYGVVLLLALPLLAACGAGANSPVTASTPPDAAHVAVTRTASPQLLNTAPLYGTPKTVAERTFTKAADVDRLYATLNVAADWSAATGTPDRYATRRLPLCPGAAESAPKDFGLMYRYDFTFTAHGGQPVERVVVSLRCSGAGMQRGWAPTLALGPEVGADATLFVAIDMVYHPKELPVYAG